MQYATSPAVTQWIEEARFPSVVSDRFLSDWETNEVDRNVRVRPIDAVTTLKVEILDTPHHWYASGLKQIDALRVLVNDWHETGAMPPTATAVGLSKAVLTKLSEVGFPPDRIDPSSAGGICISFQDGDRYADVECLNSGNIIALTMEGHSNPIVWDVEPFEISGVVADIDAFISR